MPPRTKTQEEREQERNIIIQAALNVFAHEGYAGVTMRKVAAECGISATKIYYYFASKEELYFCLMKQGFTMALQKMKEAYCEGETAEGRLLQVAQAMFEFGAENPHYYRLMLSESVPRKADYQENSPLYEIAEEAMICGMEYFDFWAKCVKEMGQECGTKLSKYDYAALFSMVHGAINLMHSRILQEAHVEFGSLCEKVKEELIKKIMK